MTPEARCIKERSSDLRHSCGALLNATPAPTGALQVFLDHKKNLAPVDLVTWYNDVMLQSNMAGYTMFVRVVDEMMNVIDFVEIGRY